MIMMSNKHFEAIKRIQKAWGKFETLRTEYELSSHDDDIYCLEILEIPYVKKLISQEEYSEYVEKLGEFLKIDDNGDYNNFEYTYEELDEFIENLNPIYKK